MNKSINNIIPVSLSTFNVFEILIMTYLFYRVILFLKDTRAEYIARGILLLVFLYIFTDFIDAKVLNWLLSKIVTGVFIALPIVFQPEVRKALEKMGRKSFFGGKLSKNYEQILNEVINTVADSANTLARIKIGALIVIEKGMRVKEFVEGGISVSADVSYGLLLSIFNPQSPLHDGAVIIKGEKILYAKCVLPLSDEVQLSPLLGTRHRAALGLTEQVDALVVVVSEERGTVSVVYEGRIASIRDEKSLAPLLLQLMGLQND